MSGSSPLTFVTEPHPAPTPPDRRAAALQDPGFGRIFTDHMAAVRYREGEGWHDAKIMARAAIPMDPATAVLQYSQQIFEGLKAYRAADGGGVMFRPEENARRFQKSAERMAMPILPEETFVAALDALIKIDRDWIPEGDGSLYLRPFMFASEVFLGVKPSSEYLFLVIASPVGSYFKSKNGAVSVWVSQDITRAGPGGTGAAKSGGNYASSLLAQLEAAKAATEWTAWQLVFQPQLGRPGSSCSAGRYTSRPRSSGGGSPATPMPHEIFVTGGFIAGAGGIAAFVVAVAMSVWRASLVRARSAADTKLSAALC
jgi:branched-chain amino acid aminotransferase